MCYFMDPLQGYGFLKGKIAHTSLTPYKDAYYVLFVMGPLQGYGPLRGRIAHTSLTP